MTDRIECVVIGAGVIGLALARHLSQHGYEVLVLEAEGAIGTGTSSRNSEVIHAGIYYSPDSLMAQLCLLGRDALYDFCLSEGIPHKKCGKLIVATTDDEAHQLEAIRQRASRNGVELIRLDADEARTLEPALRCTGALLSPLTGIIDSHAYMLTLRGHAENAGAIIALNAPLRRGQITTKGFELDIGGAEPTRIAATYLFNAAGLAAPLLAREIEGMPAHHIAPVYYAKGNYFGCKTRSPFSKLIYPMPQRGGLGVHLTLDMAGQARFGPDIEWINHIDYDVDESRAEKFYPAIRRYWPGLPDGALAPSYSGIRPKIVPPEIASQDFLIQGEKIHGVPGLVNLFGIESPGLTSSLAIAAYAASLIT